LELDDDAKKTF